MVGPRGPRAWGHRPRLPGDLRGASESQRASVASGGAIQSGGAAERGRLRSDAPQRSAVAGRPRRQRHGGSPL